MSLLNNKKKSLIALLVTQLLFACGSSDTTSVTTSPEIPEIPEVPETPETPVIPEVPEIPDIPTNEPTDPDDDSLSNVVLSCGDNDGVVENNRLNTNAKKHILCLHNEIRSEVALGVFDGLQDKLPYAQNMKRLQWDNELEQVAQNWANQCQWQHNANRSTEYNALAPLDIDGNVSQQQVSVGENLAAYSSNTYTKAEISAAISGYQLWQNEGRSWAFGTINGTEECTDSSCGHFTQLIWADTYKVGCAVNFCEAGTISDYPSTFLVCDYASAGNYIGQESYLTGNESEICNATTSDQDSCKNGLIENIHYQEGL